VRNNRWRIEFGERFGEVADISAKDRQPDWQEPDADQVKGDAGGEDAAGDLSG
jgi:hypothetical protein